MLKEAKGRIQGSIGDLAAPLKERLTDNNKPLVLATMSIIGMVVTSVHSFASHAFAGNIAEAMGEPFKKYLSTLVPDVLSNLADAKVCTSILLLLAVMEPCRTTCAHQPRPRSTPLQAQLVFQRCLILSCSIRH